MESVPNRAITRLTHTGVVGYGEETLRVSSIIIVSICELPDRECKKSLDHL